MNVDIDAVAACADLVGRTGAQDFQIGFLNDPDEEPEVFAKRGYEWYAHAQYKGARVQVEGYAMPDEAADALAKRLLAGGECAHCHQRVVLSDQPGCRWRRMADRWARGCE